MVSAQRVGASPGTGPPSRRPRRSRVGDAAGICTPAGWRPGGCQRAQRADRPHARPGCGSARSRPRSRTCGHPARRTAGTSNTNCVCTNCAPAATFLRRAGAARTVGAAAGFSDRAEQPARRRHELAAGQQPALVAHRPGRPEQLHAVQVEHRLGLGVVAEPRVVAGHQQHVRYAQRRRGRAARTAARSGSGPGR